jgi:hypothetical protein
MWGDSFFDARKCLIAYDAHYSLGHLKSSVTWREVNHHVYNITIQHVNACISVCPVCIHAHPQIPKSKGADILYILVNCVIACKSN